jgi:hypothetical protein
MKIIPTWGYKSDGSAEIFDLKEGESLPDGWADRPEPWNHPNCAHLYKRPEPDWPPPGHAIRGGYQEPAPDVAVPEPQATEVPPKKRRGRPRQSEVNNP